MNVKKLEFKYPVDRRPPRRTPGAAAAAAKTFGVIRYTAQPPHKAEPAPLPEAK